MVLDFNFISVHAKQINGKLAILFYKGKYKQSGEDYTNFI
jgi:hypothetical protein